MAGEKSKKELEKQKREEEKQERLRLKEAERIRKEEEKQRREEERLRKEAEKEQERLRKEDEKRKKDEEKEQERLRKEDEKRKKDEERLRKEEEKRKKDEEREQERLRKEEEKRRKDEEKEQERVKREDDKRKREEDKEQERLKKKLKLDEQELKAKRQAEFMQSFLKKTPVPVPSTSSADVSMEVDSPETPKFRAMPFQLKSGMALAPLHRRPSPSLSLVRKELFNSTTDGAPSFEPYLLEVKKRGGRKSTRTQVVKEVDEDVEIEIIDPKIVIDNPAEAGLVKWRLKLLQFHRNVRPPYWGTWKRRPSRVGPRAPFAKESEVDYDFDSDDEWEEEPEDGEDLGDKDDADKEEDEKSSVGVGGGDEDFDEEDDFLVPHGYLSDDEGGVPEYRDKDTLKSLEEEFYRDLKRENINGFPVIETDNLEQYTMIFYPDEENESDMGDEADTEDEEDVDRDVAMKMKLCKTEGVAVAGA